MSVKTKPFAKMYRLRTEQGLLLFNGQQLTKIEGKKAPDTADGWDITFYFTDGSNMVVSASNWTKEFAQDVFDLDEIK